MMNIRKRPAALIAALLMIILWTSQAEAGQPAGFLDYADGRTVYGWAWDPGSPGSALEIQISVRNARDDSLLFTQTCSAGQYREDLKNIGGGSHAFAASLDLLSAPRGSYIIEASSRGVPLTGSLYWQGESYPIQAEEPHLKETPCGPLSPPAGNTDEPAVTAFSAKAVIAESASAVPTNTPAPQPVSLGSFRTTAYCPCRLCSGRWGRLTSTGATAVSGHTAAVDPQAIPYGAKLMIDGIIYTAEDDGSEVNGRHIDIYFDTHAEAAAYGMQNKEVYLIP